jgi:hypothetical protein
MGSSPRHRMPRSIGSVRPPYEPCHDRAYRPPLAEQERGVRRQDGLRHEVQVDGNEVGTRLRQGLHHPRELIGRGVKGLNGRVADPVEPPEIGGELRMALPAQRPSRKGEVGIARLRGGRPDAVVLTEYGQGGPVAGGRLGVCREGVLKEAGARAARATRPRPVPALHARRKRRSLESSALTGR